MSEQSKWVARFCVVCVVKYPGEVFLWRLRCEIDTFFTKNTLLFSKLLLILQSILLLYLCDRDNIPDKIILN